MKFDRMVELRDYQQELFRKIEKEKSCIVFLPAGSGKTYIAFRLIESMAEDLKKPISEGGKRTFFLVNTIQLVQQQGNFLSELGNFKVATLTGDSGVDYFNETHWCSLEDAWEIFVLTPQIYLDALNHSYLRAENANLLVFDECHHAVGNHPMAQVMRLIQKCEDGKKPKILGLSATLLNANIRSLAPDDFGSKLGNLKSMFGGKIITSENSSYISESHSAKPNERIVNLEKYEISEKIMNKLKKLRDDGAEILKVVKLKDDMDSASCEKQREIQSQKPGSNRSRLLLNVLNDILVHVEENGLYVGYICCQSYIIQLYRHMFVTRESRCINVLSYTINLTLMMRKILYTSIEKRSFGNGFETVETILETSCGKVKYLLDLLRRIKPTDTCLIFVRRKMTAKSLFKILKISTKERELSIDFIVGSDSNPLRNVKEEFYDGKERRQVLENFKSGFINVLVSTDVLEEGIDIQRCNLVIMFDPIQTYRSYIQSKGRARVSKGEYIILDDEGGDIHTQINHFKNIDLVLNKIVDENDIKPQEKDKLSGYQFSETNLNEYKTSIGASVSSVSAISIIYLYCASLPRDLFTDLLPYWFYDPVKSSCRVQLPSSAGFRTSIQGPRRSNYKTAKQAAALETVKILHQSGRLDDHLVPVRIPKELSNVNYWFPNWDFNDNEEQEKAKMRNDSPDNTFYSRTKVPEFLEGSRPISNTVCYLHIIHMKPEYEKPKLQRHIFCHNLMENNDYKFGILTRKPLPSIFEFSTYTDLGEVRVTIQVNAETLSFSEKELKDISKFHRTLFLDILKVVQKCFIYDIEGESNGYFVVPLRPCKRSSEAVKLSWKCIERKLETSVVRPSDEEIRNQVYTAENYVGKVVTPWYKEGLRYIVCDVSNEKNLTSSFGNEKFATFEEYFFRRYSLKPLRPGQPLLLVRPITANIDGIVPRPISVSGRNRKRSKRDSETYLPPEYCHTYSFPSVYWYKTILLPSVLHRMFHLLIAEELRRRIVNEANVGSLRISQEAKGDDTIHLLKKNFKTRKNDFQVALERDKRLGEVIVQKGDKVENRYTMKDTIEVQKYHEITCTPTVFMHDFTRIPKLMTLKSYNFEHSPQAHQILEALTLRCSGDNIHLERLEALGDSLLKYLVSVSTYLKCPDMNEGHLTILKSQLVSNQNLFYCGKKLNMASYIKAVHFSTKTTWHPPGFLIPNLLGKCFSGYPLSSLLAAKIPYHEQFSGNISMETIERILKTDIANYIQELEEKDELQEKRINFYFGRQKLKRKDVSDVLEALLGVYLEACGIEGAFKLLKYFGILGNETMVELFSKIPPPNSLDSTEIIDIHALLPGCETIENLCGYQFKNKFYLLQAFTHPSFRTNYITDCYQKLEFIGDAVLDFLITSYIYQYCGNLTPGQLTDLKSSLVNNNTFGALAVRLKLHQHLLCHSERLWKAIETFATYQENKNNEIHGNELIILINETDTAVAEEVDVPKALGDVFESLAGAIFLDSSCNLSVVWNSFYKILQEEINKFSKNIPINAIRALYEKVPTKVSFIQMSSEAPQDIGGDIKEKTKVLLKIILNEKTRSYIGQGDNIKAAKRAAAKYALRDLNCDKFVI